MKLITFFTVLWLMAMSATAKADDKNISVDDLPSQARFLLRTEFPSSKIQSVLMNEDEQFFVVQTEDESTLTFNESGEWTSLECPQIGVPSFIIPQKIQTAVKKNCGPRTMVVQIKKISRGRYDVELSNGFGLRFDKKLEIIDVRDRDFMVQKK